MAEWDLRAALADAESRMQRTVALFERELAGMRAGRAHPALLDKVTVDYYGSPTPLAHLAQVSVPEPRTLVVQPYDKSAVASVEKGIQKADLGVSIRVEGDVLRLAIPVLTEERRRDLVRQVKRLLEDQKVAIRNVRREVLEQMKQAERTGSVSEDESRRGQDQLQKLTDRLIARLDELGLVKERELLQP
ncbi:MAG: ribosome recycling factor [Firmicutes bacterium]|jgi:ribosome recycling factor|nr:ribosome recycling factor [Bacillota bacterium]